MPAGEDGARWRPKARLAAVAEFIARVAQEGRTLVVTNKRVRCALTGENDGAKLPVSGRYAGADIAHFGNIRGTNEFEDHDVVIILGREQPSPRDAERRAMAIWYDTKRPIRQIKQNGGGRRSIPTESAHTRCATAAGDRCGSGSTPIGASKRWWNRSGRPRWSRPLTGSG